MQIRGHCAPETRRTKTPKEILAFESGERYFYLCILLFSFESINALQDVRVGGIVWVYLRCVCVTGLVVAAAVVVVAECVLKEPRVGVKAQRLVLRASDEEINRESYEIKSVN